MATTKDLRVILVKLADRLHNMRTIQFIKDENKKTKIALETLEVFAPLAQRLGMKEWQDELEDISFEVINPDAKKTIIERLEYLKSKDDNPSKLAEEPELTISPYFFPNILLTVFSSFFTFFPSTNERPSFFKTFVTALISLES